MFVNPYFQKFLEKHRGASSQHMVNPYKTTTVKGIGIHDAIDFTVPSVYHECRPMELIGVHHRTEYLFR